MMNPFSTLLIAENPDYNSLDLENAVRNLFERTSMTDKMLAGEISPDDFLSFLESQEEITPDEYVDEVVENVEWVLGNAQFAASGF